MSQYDAHAKRINSLDVTFIFFIFYQINVI